jgi:hypothetical protein
LRRLPDRRRREEAVCPSRLLVASASCGSNAAIDRDERFQMLRFRLGHQRKRLAHDECTDSLEVHVQRRRQSAVIFNQRVEEHRPKTAIVHKGVAKALGACASTTRAPPAVSRRLAAADWPRAHAARRSPWRSSHRLCSRSSPQCAPFLLNRLAESWPKDLIPTACQSTIAAVTEPANRRNQSAANKNGGAFLPRRLQAGLYQKL